MKDTVTRLMKYADEWADECGGCDSSHMVANSKYRQALRDELTRLFTPLSDEQVVAGFHQQHYRVECSHSFEAGVRWAEKQPSIGGES